MTDHDVEEWTDEAGVTWRRPVLAAPEPSAMARGMLPTPVFEEASGPAADPAVPARPAVPVGRMGVTGPAPDPVVLPPPDPPSSTN